MSHRLPSADIVAETLGMYPREMLVSNAAAVAEHFSLTSLDVLWLVAGYEANKPRVFRVTVSESIVATEAFR